VSSGAAAGVRRARGAQAADSLAATLRARLGWNATVAEDGAIVALPS
jgi:hypothetical protein